MSEHALLGCGALVEAADSELAPRLSAGVIAAAVADVPAEWLDLEPGIGGPAELREAYAAQLTARLDARPAWLPGVAAAARAGLAGAAPRGRGAGRPGRPSWLESRPPSSGGAA